MILPVFKSPRTSLAMLPAVRINAKGREVIYLAKGQSARLVCPYELEAHDDGPDSLDIEWTRMNSDPTSLDNVILSYHDHKVIYPGEHYVQQRGSFGARETAQRVSGFHVAKESSVRHPLGPVAECCSGLQQRINFAIPDPSQYDASINLQDVQISDSATYECKVKKTTLASRKVTIMVLERPSVPKCSITGKVSLGHEVTLCCAADAGNSPLAYQWSRVAGHLHGNTISAFATKGVHPGDIVIKNLSREHVGLYQCSVANKVGYSQCVLEISLADDSNQLVVVIGAVLGSLLFLILLLCLTMWIIYCVRRRKFKEEVNQIRVDSAPPRGRGGRKSNQRPNQNTQRGKYYLPKEQEEVEML
uniref:Ig-like domain-containing protein n=1 Tax=Anolis carolinensis TaxID=28377 RepID=A0A803TUF8_ANOCA